MTPRDVILIILTIVAIIIALALTLASRDEAQSKTGSARSKLEERIIRTLEDLTGARFDQAHPSWLTDERSRVLELDGFNEKLKIAIEVQGPGHTKPMRGESAKKYEQRVARDKLKHELCKKHGVHLITVDHKIAPFARRDYLASRLFDVGFFTEKPPNYLALTDPLPWRVEMLHH